MISGPGGARPVGTFGRPWRPNGERQRVGVCGRRSGEASSTGCVILSALGFPRASPGRDSRGFARTRRVSEVPGGRTERRCISSL